MPSYHLRIQVGLGLIGSKGKKSTLAIYTKLESGVTTCSDSLELCACSSV